MCRKSGGLVDMRTDRIWCLFQRVIDGEIRAIAAVRIATLRMIIPSPQSMRLHFMHHRTATGQRDHNQCDDSKRHHSCHVCANLFLDDTMVPDLSSGQIPAILFHDQRLAKKNRRIRNVRLCFWVNIRHSPRRQLEKTPCRDQTWKCGRTITARSGGFCR